MYAVPLNFKHTRTYNSGNDSYSKLPQQRETSKAQRARSYPRPSQVIPLANFLPTVSSAAGRQAFIIIKFKGIGLSLFKFIAQRFFDISQNYFSSPSLNS